MTKCTVASLDMNLASTSYVLVLYAVDIITKIC